MNVTTMRPVLGLDVDGVIAVEPPPHVEVNPVRVTAWGRWTREVLVPASARRIVAELSDSYEIVWVSAWGHNAHTSLAPVLGLEGDTWRFLPVQFGQAAAVSRYARDRPWALINDGTDFKVQSGTPGAIVHVNAHRGIDDVEVSALLDLTMEIAAERNRDHRGSHDQENMK